MTTPIPSATVILLRDTPSGMKVLLLRRNSKIAYGGSWVFPGGRIDEHEFQHSNNDNDHAARLAAIRETEEEAGIQIEEKDLVLFSHWTTPIIRPKRFSTWFFLAAVNNKEVKIDGGEIHDFYWHTPANALIAQREQQIELPAPTFVTLTQLQQFQNSQDTLAHFRQAPTPRIQPNALKTESGAIYLYNGDAGYDAKNPDLKGPQHRLVQPKDGPWQYICEIENP